MAEIVYRTPEKISTANADQQMTGLCDAASKALAETEKTLAIDMSETVYISSAGLRAIMTAMKRICAANGSFILRGVSDHVRETLKLTGVLDLIRIE